MPSGSPKRPMSVNVPGEASCLPLADDGNRAAGAVDHGMTDRSEEHPLECSPATGADHHQAGVGGGTDERELGGTVLDADGDVEARVALVQPVRCRIGNAGR